MSDAESVVGLKIFHVETVSCYIQVMPHKPSRPKDDPEQSKRFIETARELGCDEDEAAFDEKLKRIATAKTAPKLGLKGKQRRPSKKAFGSP